MQGIYTYSYIPETNHIPMEYSVAAIQYLLLMGNITLVSVLSLLYCSFTLLLSEVCAVSIIIIIIIIIIIRII
jgi:hypothetical protein